MKIFLLAGFLLESLCHQLIATGARTSMQTTWQQVTNYPWVTHCSSTFPIATAQHRRCHPVMVNCPRGKLNVWGSQSKNFHQALSRRSETEYQMEWSEFVQFFFFVFFLSWKVLFSFLLFLLLHISCSKHAFKDYTWQKENSQFWWVKEQEKQHRIIFSLEVGSSRKDCSFEFF